MFSLNILIFFPILCLLCFFVATLSKKKSLFSGFTKADRVSRLDKLPFYIKRHLFGLKWRDTIYQIRDTSHEIRIMLAWNTAASLYKKGRPQHGR
jgi:hypothetical protein